VLGLYGAEDASIPPDQVEAMKEKLEAAERRRSLRSIRRWPWIFADYRQSYRADVAQDAWMTMQAWFKNMRLGLTVWPARAPDQARGRESAGTGISLCAIPNKEPA